MLLYTQISSSINENTEAKAYALINSSTVFPQAQRKPPTQQYFMKEELKKPTCSFWRRWWWWRKTPHSSRVKFALLFLNKHKKFFWQGKNAYTIVVFVRSWQRATVLHNSHSSCRWATHSPPALRSRKWKLKYMKLCVSLSLSLILCRLEPKWSEIFRPMRRPPFSFLLSSPPPPFFSSLFPLYNTLDLAYISSFPPQILCKKLLTQEYRRNFFHFSYKVL